MFYIFSQNQWSLNNQNFYYNASTGRNDEYKWRKYSIKQIISSVDEYMDVVYSSFSLKLSPCVLWEAVWF